MTAMLQHQAQAADWIACERCRVLVYGKQFTRRLGVCPECGWHSQLSAAERVGHLFDPGSVQVLELADRADDPLGFVDQLPYPERRDRARRKTGLTCGVMVASGRIGGHRLVAAVMDFRFIGGSLGAAEGAAVDLAAERALTDRVPLLVVTASGGARMQEGALSLMQMAKTSAAFAELDRAGLLTISLIADPTYGGVAASFASLSDVIIAEPGARMGFAGRRVIEATVGENLPADFQTAEYLRAHGMVDDVQPRSQLRAVLSRLLAATGGVPVGWGIGRADSVLRDLDEVPVRDPWEVVQTAREPARPTTGDHFAHLLDGFFELRGDRGGEDCRAVLAGIGLLDGLPVVAIGHQKGHTVREMVEHQFGMPSPAGFRKAARAMRLAEKLGLPVVTLVDTPGAHPGIAAEERGQAAAIAENLRLMSRLRVPVVAVITGEGGSGGALALAVADTVLVSLNGTYSVISPEGCAAILWRDAGQAPKAAAALGLEARSLLRDGIVDGVVPEPPGGSHCDPVTASEFLLAAVVGVLAALVDQSPSHLVDRRVARFRRFGERELATGRV